MRHRRNLDPSLSRNHGLRREKKQDGALMSVGSWKGNGPAFVRILRVLFLMSRERSLVS